MKGEQTNKNHSQQILFASNQYEIHYLFLNQLYKTILILPQSKNHFRGNMKFTSLVEDPIVVLNTDSFYVVPETVKTNFKNYMHLFFQHFSSLLK